MTIASIISSSTFINIQDRIGLVLGWRQIQIQIQIQIHDGNHEHIGELGPVKGVTTATKAYPEAPYSERSYSYLYLQLLNIYVIRLNIYVISKL